MSCKCVNLSRDTSLYSQKKGAETTSWVISIWMKVDFHLQNFTLEEREKCTNVQNITNIINVTSVMYVFFLSISNMIVFITVGATNQLQQILNAGTDDH